MQLNNMLVGILSNRKSLSVLTRNWTVMSALTALRTCQTNAICPCRHHGVQLNLVKSLYQHFPITQDDWYGEYFFIPKGSIVVINWWGIHYDPIYPPIFFFFLKKNGEVHQSYPFSGEESELADLYRRSHFGFGGGRRICPRMHVTERRMFLNIARTLLGVVSILRGMRRGKGSGWTSSIGDYGWQ